MNWQCAILIDLREFALIALIALIILIMSWQLYVGCAIIHGVSVEWFVFSPHPANECPKPLDSYPRTSAAHFIDVAGHLPNHLLIC